MTGEESSRYKTSTSWKFLRSSTIPHRVRGLKTEVNAENANHWDAIGWDKWWAGHSVASHSHRCPVCQDGEAASGDSFLLPVIDARPWCAVDVRKTGQAITINRWRWQSGLARLNVSIKQASSPHHGPHISNIKNAGEGCYEHAEQTLEIARSVEEYMVDHRTHIIRRNPGAGVWY